MGFFKVLYISVVGERGGSETVLLNILKYHDQNRFHPMVCFLKDGPLVEEVRGLGVKTFLVPTTRFRDIASTLAAVRAIRHILKGEAVDIVFGNMPTGHLFASLASLGTHVKRVAFRHGIPSTNDAINWLVALLPAERLYVNSKATLQAQSRFLNRAKRLQLLYYGLDLSLFPSPITNHQSPITKFVLTREFGILPDAPTVAMVARFQRQKGQHVFIQAAAEVCRRYPDARFLLIGDTQFGLENDYKAGLKALVEQLGLSQHVIFTRFRNDVPRLLKEVDIVAHPHVAPEGFGLAVAEALLMGKPVVASNLGGPTEIITDSETGFLVPPGDAKALAEKILLLLNDKELRQQMGEKGQEMVLQRFTMERMIMELEQSYMEILGG